MLLVVVDFPCAVLDELPALMMGELFTFEGRVLALVGALLKLLSELLTLDGCGVRPRLCRLVPGWAGLKKVGLGVPSTGADKLIEESSSSSSEEYAICMNERRAMSAGESWWMRYPPCEILLLCSVITWPCGRSELLGVARL